jgi:hypothetical protein
MKVKLHSGHIEVILARYLDYRLNLIVPNISYGLNLHEIDLLILTPSHYAWEIEIKTSLSDLKMDKKKSHGHYSNKIKRLYFAVPKELEEKALELIPERAGLFVIYDNKYVKCVKTPIINKKARPFTEQEIQHLYELAAMRIWSLKEALYNKQK